MQLPWRVLLSDCRVNQPNRCEQTDVHQALSLRGGNINKTHGMFPMSIGNRRKKFTIYSRDL